MIYVIQQSPSPMTADSWTQLADWLRLVRWAGQRFRQEAIYLEVAGLPEVLWLRRS